MLQNISFDIAESRFWAVFDAVGESLQNLVLKIRTWVSFHNLSALFFYNRVKAKTKNIIFYPTCHQSNLGRHMQWNFRRGMQRNSHPDLYCIPISNAMRKQKSTCFIGSVYLESLIG